MINFIRVVIPNARACFTKMEHRIHLCSTLNALNNTAPEVGLETRKESHEFNIFEVSRIHAEPFKSLKPIILNDIKTLDKTLYAPHVNDRLVELMDQEDILFWDDIRPLSVVAACEEIAKSRGHTLTNTELHDTYLLAWIFKVFEMYAIAIDDICDDHPIRYGKPTWYYKNDKHPLTTYDIYGLLHLSRSLFSKYFKNKFYYHDIQKVITQSAMIYMWGEHSGVITEGRQFLDMIKTMKLEAYLDFTSYKVAYNFQLPIDFGLYMNDMYDEEDADKISKACRLAGCMFQCWDDFTDREGDLEDGRCTWITILALNKATDSQKKILMDNYGKTDEKSRSAVLEVYQEMDIKKIFYDDRKNMIQTMKNELKTVKNSAVGKVIINIAINVEDYHI